MQLLNWTDDQMEALAAHSPSLAVTVPSYVTQFDETEDAPTARDTFLAAVQRENFTFEFIRDAGYRIQEVDISADGVGFSHADVAPTEPFNQYSAMSKEDREEFDLEIRQGMFEAANTPAKLAVRKKELRRSRELARIAQEGPGVAYMAGALATAPFDVVTWLPFLGPLNKITRGSKIATGALGAALGIGTAEAGLQTVQEYRTAQESFMNIGVATVLGGGIGAFARYLHPDHPMNPSKGNKNPLHPDNIGKDGVGVRMHNGTEDFSHSVGAAEVTGQYPEGAKTVFSEVPGLRWAAKKWSGVSPEGQWRFWRSGKTRQILANIMDLGGQLTKDSQFGVKIGHSAEDIRRTFAKHKDGLFLWAEKRYTQLNVELGDSALKARIPMAGRISSDHYAYYTRKALFDEFSDADFEVLAKEYGEDGANMIKGAAEEYAQRIHQTNNRFGDELERMGVFQDPQHVTDLEAQLDQIEVQLAQLRDIEKQKAAAGEGPTSGQSKIDLKAKRKELQTELNRETSKPLREDNYGHARMYHIPNIILDREGFEDWLLEVLVEHPHEDWLLNEKGLTLTHWEKLGKEEITLNGETISTQAGSEMRTQIMREWAGDEYTFRLYRAERQERAAEVAYNNAKVDFLHVVDMQKGLDRLSGTFSIQKARAYRNKYLSELTAARAERDRLKLEARQELVTEKTKTYKTRQARDKNRGRIMEIKRNLRQAGKRVRDLEAHAGRMEKRFQEVELRHKNLNELREANRELLSEVRKAHKVAAKDVASLKRTLKRLRKDTPLDKVVRDISVAITDKGNNPRGILDYALYETGRVKARSLPVTPALRRLAEEKGYLRTDLSAILSNQYDQMAGYIGIHQGLDIRPGGRYESWTSVLDDIADDYNALIAKAPDKDRPGLRQELVNAQKDAVVLRDRLMGTEDAGLDKDSWTYWLSQKFRQAVTTRFTPSFMLSSLTDLASIHLHTSQPLGRLLRQHGAEAVKVMKDAYHADPNDFMAMVQAVELGSNGRMARAMDADDLYNTLGIGAEGTWKHRVTSRVDRVTNATQNYAMQLSGMPLWNRFWKVLSGVYRTHRIRDMVGRYSTLASKDVDDLASLGIGPYEAKRLDYFMKKYAKTGDDGYLDVGLDDWIKENGGFEARRDFEVAIERDMTRSIFTPGIGSTPRLQSKWYGKLFLHLQSYAFTFQSRYALPASQRLANHQDMAALTSFAHLMIMGAVVMGAKDLVAGRDPMKRFEEKEWARTTHEIIDRAGLLTYLAPYVNSAFTASLEAQKDLFGDVYLGPSSKYARNDHWLTSLAGPVGGLVRDIEKLGAAAASGDGQKVLDKAIDLAPASTYFKLMQTLNTALGEP